MAALRQSHRLRAVAVVAAYPALMGLAVLALSAFDDGTLGVGFALGATVVYAALVFRWWTLLLPLGFAAGWLGVLRVHDWITGTCSVCGSDEDWSNAWMLALYFVVMPLTAAVTAGLVVGAIARAASRVSPRPPGRSRPSPGSSP